MTKSKAETHQTNENTKLNIFYRVGQLANMTNKWINEDTCRTYTDDSKELLRW